MATTGPSGAGGELVRRLTDLGYLELFQRFGEEAVDAVWATPGAPAELRRLALDPAAPMPARFLAAEVLFARQPGYPPETAKGDLAPVYAAALDENLPRMANPWGLPGQLDGPVGQHAVALGEPAAAALAGLLGDDRPIHYSGSEEATFGNSYRYRVKDIAAFLIASIRSLPFAVDRDPGVRDAEIERLRRSLS
jgi:hypothetical protein